MKKMILAALVAAVVTVLVGLVFEPLRIAVVQVVQKRFEDSSLQLVDADLLEDSYDEMAKLDVKLRNPGESVALIDHAVFDVKKVWILYPAAFHTLILP